MGQSLTSKYLPIELIEKFARLQINPFFWSKSFCLSMLINLFLQNLEREKKYHQLALFHPQNSIFTRVQTKKSGWKEWVGYIYTFRKLAPARPSPIVAKQGERYRSAKGG